MRDRPIRRSLSIITAQTASKVSRASTMLDAVAGVLELEGLFHERLVHQVMRDERLVVLTHSSLQV